MRIKGPHNRMVTRPLARVLSRPNLCPGRKNQRLVADEPVEFEKQPVEVQEFMKFSDQFKGIYRKYLKWMKAEPEDVDM